MNHPQPSQPNPATSRQTPARTSRQDADFNRARASLRQSLSWYSHVRRLKQHSQDTELQSALLKQLDILTGILSKLDCSVIRISAFGLVSRGKSAVLNALTGQKILQTGPINGVTQWPRSVRWTPHPDSKVQVELIDTPGLDEVDGQERARMAREVARQSDLILFVVAGDITRTEYQALCELRQTQKPVILVFNKIDLYPEQDRQAIYQQLQQLATGAGAEQFSEQFPNEIQAANSPSPDDIVMVAAEPAPLSVRVEWPDGRITHEWETPAPQIAELKDKILDILNREGRSLLALNALMQARDAQATIAGKTVESRQKQAEDLIWEFAKYKAAAVALNPIAFLDLLAGTVADLILIRSLARLYGLPMTGYQAGKLWKQIIFSAGGLLLGEMGSSLLFGAGKTAAALAPAGITAYAGAAIAQASLAGYGTYTVGQAAQVYLERGCTWGATGPDTVIQDILDRAEPNTVIARLRQEFSVKNGAKAEGERVRSR
ncbi:GTP-binding protein [Kamptonema formosum]|uniref:GTP-binding protein n=1 Tax=Kamptonema formosum TaxID=331992 RepID=UPI0003770738|nr:GTP-binding protein [Oscillatoria sp. PCC 10802]